MTRGERPRVALDAMGGDHGPGEIVTGALRAVERLGVEVVIVGDEGQINACLEGEEVPDGLSVVGATDVIEMGENPIDAVRAKKGASINVAVRLVKERNADAFVTLGNTGAAMTAALLSLGRVRGIGRPALGLIFPTGATTREILLDIGANADGRPIHLLQFAHMGSAYMRLIHGIESPRVALLSNGTEAGKGNALVVETFELLEQSKLNFIGNIEGTDLVTPTADVVVMDGFTGNIMLKTAEAMAELIVDELRGAFNRRPWNRLAGLVIRRDLRPLRRRIDYSEYGGAQLLGVNGVTVIGHGRSQAPAVFGAIRASRDAVRNGLIEVMEEIGREMPARRAESPEG